jgi:hypothetical protein
MELKTRRKPHSILKMYRMKIERHYNNTQTSSNISHLSQYYPQICLINCLLTLIRRAYKRIRRARLPCVDT